MKTSSTADIVKVLEKNNELLRIKYQVDPHLEMAEIQRRIYRDNGPAILFENVKDCQFQCISNIYGTTKRAKLLFKKTYKAVRSIISAKGDPVGLLKHPFGAMQALVTAGYGLR